MKKFLVIFTILYSVNLSSVKAFPCPEAHELEDALSGVNVNNLAQGSMVHIPNFAPMRVSNITPAFKAAYRGGAALYYEAALQNCTYLCGRNALSFIELVVP